MLGCVCSIYTGVRSWTGTVPVRVATWLCAARVAAHRLGLVLIRRVRHSQTLPEKSQILHPALRLLYRLVRHADNLLRSSRYKV